MATFERYVKYVNWFFLSQRQNENGEYSSLIELLNDVKLIPRCVVAGGMTNLFICFRTEPIIMLATDNNSLINSLLSALLIVLICMRTIVFSRVEHFNKNLIKFTKLWNQDDKNK